MGILLLLIGHVKNQRMVFFQEQHGTASGVSAWRHVEVPTTTVVEPLLHDVTRARRDSLRSLQSAAYQIITRSLVYLTSRKSGRSSFSIEVSRHCMCIN